ncbi:MAG: UDP-4-amino-4,6-dideoxy-N-acetyl-beta-L-altrosamine transaminase [Aestuariibacter sp.]
MIPYGRHVIDEADIDAVVDVLRNQFLTQGEQVPAFENAIASFVGANYCTAVNSGTSALHVACLALGCTRGDLVWTVPNSFVATANCARYCGADIDFVDIDSQTRNISPEALRTKLISAQKKGRLPKILIIVHFAGFSCDTKTLYEICQSYGVALIEDAAHAFGGYYLDKPVGNCQYSDLTVFSFHPVKTITSAEGGAITSNSPAVQQRLQLFAKHGITRQQDHFKALPAEPWVYEQQELGFNYRLSDIHAALGLSQVKKTQQFVQSRQAIATAYSDNLADLPLILPMQPDYCVSAWHLYVVELQTHSRETVFTKLREANVGVNVHYIPIHLQPYYRQLGFASGDFPNAEGFYNMALSLPIFPTMTENQQDHVVKTLTEILN